MVLKEELVEIYYNADRKNPPIDMTCLDMLITDSLKVVADLIANGLAQKDLDAYYDSLNL